MYLLLFLVYFHPGENQVENQPLWSWSGMGFVTKRKCYNKEIQTPNTEWPYQLKKKHLKNAFNNFLLNSSV